MSGRLITSMLRRLDGISACDQCWALSRVSSCSSSLGTTAAAAAAQWPTPGRWQPFSSSAAAQATAAATSPAAAAAAQQEPGAAAAADSQPTQKQAQAPRKQPAATAAAAAAAGFEELQTHYQRELKLRNIRGEANLLLLINQARQAEQVSAAMELLRWDKMVRARQQRRYEHFSPHTIRALLRAGRQAQMGPRFAVQLLQEADELGMQVSLGTCEDVIEYCISKQDFWAAAEAWVYTRVYCADPSRRQPAAAEAAAAAAAAADRQPPQHKQREGPLGWASTSLVRAYAKGLGVWLKQGCVSQEHEQYVRKQLVQLVQELESRGASVSDTLKQQASEEPQQGAAAGAAAPGVEAEAEAEVAETEADSQPEAAGEKQ